MLSLRLARGAHPLVLLRRLLVAAAAAGVGFLLLCTLGYAVAHPKSTGESLVRLMWCAVPLAAVVQFALAVARTDPATRPRDGLDAIGLGPVRLSLLAAASTALSCSFGSGVALLVYLELRGDLGGTPLSGSASGLLDGNAPLPWAATLTLLGLLPVLAAGTCALALRPRAGAARAARAAKQPADAAQDPADVPAAPVVPTPPPAPKPSYTGLPWGITIITVGLAMEAYVARGPAPDPDTLLALPGSDGASPGVIGGWLLASLGLVLAGPGLTHWCGVLLAAGRPGAVRLLAGRILQDAATRIGRPLGVLCAVASASLAAAELYGAAWEADGSRPFGPLTGLGAGLVMSCVTATAITAALDSRQSRTGTTTALNRLGIPHSLLRGAAVLRTGVLLAVLTPLTWAIAELAALPMTR
ncbi:membrane protein [Streptomyces eurocidicus]|uniref:Membrane protein n=1 Tax=Streptomyces eurocidicus TaxID=66423 RepID=A0A2N8NNQ5_STREU|nr:hypothetical protein [Streptomyces eurocidicus]MBB5116685.1 hypothetical protein [Streptomyces eurocidicus]MBF6052313.1 hypothetical protein [Streptomyces eurocidicus]PNE30403.1 membrane protein [Streptomyces eurocidicus]